MTAAAAAMPGGSAVEILLCGDVMLGRGIDQILPHPGDPTLYEPYMRSAAGYVALADGASGPVPRRVDPAYVWGAALPVLERHRPDARIVNLETAVTRRGRPAPKGINYRMTPENVLAITAAGIDCCVLANNHVLDWGEEGLADTLDALAAAGLRCAGAGRDAAGAAAPAVLPLDSGGRLVVHAFASPCSGTPPDWAAGARSPGVNLLDDLSDSGIERVADQVAATRQPGDITVLSVHWGGNWGYAVPEQQRDFARKAIEAAGVDVVHGHSSHHPKAVEVHRDRAILYGCGDAINDYEGITGHASYRGDLVLLYFVGLAADGGLVRLDMVPFRIRRFRLDQASAADRAWLHAVIDQECGRLGAGVTLREDGSFHLTTASADG